MAEEDVLLVAVRMDAKGAITDTEILDSKFKNLSTTFRNSKKPVEDVEKHQKKLNKALKEGEKAATDANVANISTMLALEGMTSGLNQFISAKYKRIEADLAAGEISQEEAEAQRKQVKQQELYTSTLEKYIAIGRIVAATDALMTAMKLSNVKATIAQIKANKVLNFVLRQNPLVKLIIVITAAVLIYKKFGDEIHRLKDGFIMFGKVIKEIVELFGNLLSTTTALASSLTGIGDFMSDNPISKSISKAGGAIL
tara:strand:+ start:30 stop:794 length:765 start_codon:yes stop_codon:yes gene_type:complete